jgi:ribosomal protein S18 acetylase RimI-like enzyme
MEAVRVASTADLGRVAELAGAMTEALEARRGGDLLLGPLRPTGDQVVDGLGALLGRPDALLLVGTLDGAAVGFAVSTVEDYDGALRRGRLAACWVEPEARGVGLGRLLLDRSMAWMVEQGCLGVDGPALPGDRAAKSFYEAAGFKARLLTMHRELGQSE